MLYMEDYDADKLIRQGLVFLLPFVLFHLEDRLAGISEDPAEIAELRAEFRRIVEYYRKLLEEGEIDGWQQTCLIELTQLVTRQLTKEFPNIWKGVREVLGGEILVSRDRMFSLTE